MGVKNFVDYSNMTAIMNAIATKLNAINGAYVFRGSVAFASKPSPITEAMNGYVYNITDDFVTTADFVEGAGKSCKAGTNIVVADLSTYAIVTPAGSEDPSSEGWYELVGGKYVLSEDTTVDSEKSYYAKTVIVKWDVLGAWDDLDDLIARLNALNATIAPVFDETLAYNEGDLVMHEDQLYAFKAGGHTADDPWDLTEVDAKTVVELIAAAEPDSLTTAQVNTLVGLLD